MEKRFSFYLFTISFAIRFLLELSDDLDSQQTQIHTITETIDVHDSDIFSLNEDVSSQDERLDAVEDDVDIWDDKITALEVANVDIQDRLINLEDILLGTARADGYFMNSEVILLQSVIQTCVPFLRTVGGLCEFSL